jgi:hypothetical protein
MERWQSTSQVKMAEPLATCSVEDEHEPVYCHRQIP